MRRYGSGAARQPLVSQEKDAASSGWAGSSIECTPGPEGRCRHMPMDLDGQCTSERAACFTLDVVLCNSRVNAVEARRQCGVAGWPKEPCPKAD